MPSMYAHYSCGKKVLDILPREIQELINSHKSLYLTGLQGPDVLFYYKPLKKNRVSTYGNEMHDRPGADFFRAAAQRLFEAESSQAAAMQAYLLGFVCHFALDSICHGYVEKKIAASGVSHIQIEAEFDRFLLQQEMEVLGELVANSALPAFTTDYIMKLGDGPSDRVAVPILDEDASVTYYCACVKADRARFRPVFQHFKKA